MELFEIEGISANRKSLVVEVYGYIFREGYHGKVQPMQRRLIFYYNSAKSRQFTQEFLKQQRRADGAKSVIEAFECLVGTQIFVNRNMLRSVE